MILYHFTCVDHGAPGIDADGLIRPPTGRHTTAGLPAVVWLTDDPDIAPAALGIDPGRAVALTCDRTAVRYTVDARPIPWLGSSFRARSWPWWVELAEDRSFGADPDRWFVSPHPLRPIDRVAR